MLEGETLAIKITPGCVLPLAKLVPLEIEIFWFADDLHVSKGNFCSFWFKEKIKGKQKESCLIKKLIWNDLGKRKKMFRHILIY